MLEFRSLGTVDLRAEDGRSFRFVLAHPKRVALLAYLAAPHPARPQRRALLTALLWPELDEAHARAALRQELYLLRQSLGVGILSGEGEDALGVDGAGLWCDARAFEAALEEGQPAAALELYRGDFLPGLHVGGGEFERWVDEMRAHLARRATETARQLAAEAEATGDLAAAISWTRRLTEIARYDEAGWRYLIGLLDQSGNRAAALAAYDSLATVLRAELEVEPAPETRELVGRIRERTKAFAPAGEAAIGTTALPARAAPGSVAAVPAEVGALVGRGGRRRTVAVASGVALLAVLVTALVLVRAGRGPPVQSNRPIIGLLPVDNQTGEPGLDALARRTTDRLGEGLAKVGFADVAVGARRSDLTAVVSATLYRRGELVEALPRLIEPGAGGRLVDMPGAVLLSPTRPTEAALDSLAARVLAAVAAHYDPRFELASRPARTLPIETPSWAAYQEYVQGSELYGRGRFDEAAQRMLRAYAIDRGFVKSALFGAIALTDAARPRTADSVAAAALAAASSLTPYERAFGEWLLADLHGRRSAAYRAAREVARLGPSTPTLVIAGREALRMNRPGEAVRILQEADVERGWWRNLTAYWEVLTGALHVRGEHQAELSTALAARARFPGSLIMLGAEVRARAALGQTRQVAQLLDEATTLPRERIGPADVARTAAQELAAHGDEPAAAAARRHGLEWLARQGAGGPQEQALRSWLLLESGDPKRPCRTPSPAADDLEGLGLTGMLAAHCGDKELARRILARLEAWPDPYAGGRHLLFAAGIRAALGEPERAVATLRSALAAGLPFGVELHASTLLRPLAHRADFTALLRPRDLDIEGARP